MTVQSPSKNENTHFVCLKPPQTGWIQLNRLKRPIIVFALVVVLFLPFFSPPKPSPQIAFSSTLPTVKIPDFIEQNHGSVQRILELNDGNFAIQSVIDGDLVIFMINTQGTILWQRSYPMFDYCTGFIQTHDGGLAFTVGTYEDNNFNEDSKTTYGILIKTNGEGKIQWQKTYVYEPLSEDDSYRLAGLLQLDDDGFVLVKSAGKGIVIQKTDLNGTIESSITNSDLAAFYFMGGKIIQTIDGGFALNGLDNSYIGDGYNGLLLKLDHNFATQWSVNLGTFSPWDFEQLSNGNFIITGSNKGDTRPIRWLICIDASGTLLWKKTRPLPNWVGSSISDFIESTDSGLVMVTRCVDEDFAGTGMALIKTDASG
ncbi:MAG: hypothetical protein ACFFFH_10610 [Candidatus Thorarchaeota archaeon]